MERWQAKVVSLIICLLVLFGAVALPIKVSQLFYAQGEKGKKWLDIVNCFGGGVFLGTYLLTFPQVRLLIEDALLKPSNIHYPLPELLVGVGFFMIMFLEKTISTYNKHASKAVKSVDEVSNMNVSVTELKHSATVITFLEESHSFGETEPHVNQKGDKSPNPAKSPNPFKTPNKQTRLTPNANISQDKKDSQNITYDNVQNDIPSGNLKSPDISNGNSFHSNVAYVSDSMVDVSQVVEEEIYPKQNGTSTPVHHDSNSALKALILMAALAIDNVFIGMGLGLRGTNIGVWNMLITILSHEIVISFTLGLALVQHNSTKKVLILAAVYASMCPIGIGIGTILSDTGVAGEGVELVSGVLQSLATGVFLYVTFFEILEGHVGHNSKFPNLIAILAGFTLMALLALLEEGTTEDFHHSTLDVTTSNPFH